MNILQESRTILEKAGYRTLLETNSAGVCYFEDATLMGAIIVHDNVSNLLDNWESSQDRFLGHNSTQLRNDPIKVWNIYTIHLTSDDSKVDTTTDPFDIEQDFRGTRKIVRTGVQSKGQLRDALLPLLSVQHQIVMSPKQVKQRIKERLARASSTFVRLLEDVDEKDVAKDLLEEP